MLERPRRPLRRGVGASGGLAVAARVDSGDGDEPSGCGSPVGIDAVSSPWSYASLRPRAVLSSERRRRQRFAVLKPSLLPLSIPQYLPTNRTSISRRLFGHQHSLSRLFPTNPGLLCALSLSSSLSDRPIVDKLLLARAAAGARETAPKNLNSRPAAGKSTYPHFVHSNSCVPSPRERERERESARLAVTHTHASSSSDCAPKRASSA